MEQRNPKAMQITLYKVYFKYIVTLNAKTENPTERNRSKIEAIYRMSCDFMSILQDLIAEVIASQNYNMKKDPVLNGNRVRDGNSRLFEHT
jgi:hypothetical protein